MRQRSFRQIHPRIAGDDTVEEVRIALRQHQCFAATLRASDEVRKAGLVSVVGLEECFGLFRHLGGAVVAIVAPRLGIEAELEGAGYDGGVDSVVVSAVGRYDRIPLGELRGRRGVTQIAVRATPTRVEKSLVPGSGHPQMELDR